MASSTKQRRDQLRQSLVEIAEAKIAESGMRALTARDVAAQAGCAVGAIYNIFKDMDALIAAVNSRTAVRLDKAVAMAYARTLAVDPKGQLVLLGHTYLAFVSDNRRLWSAIFEVRFANSTLSEMQLAENGRLMAHVVAPLRMLMPDASDDARLLIARGLFSAVHGIVTLGQQGRFTAVSRDGIAEQIRVIVEAFCDGMLQRNKLLNA